MEKSKAFFGTVESIVEQTRKQRFIAKRVGEIQAKKHNTAKLAKKTSTNNKNLNHNHTKHL